MKLNSLQELYTEQLRDLYDAENQIIKALPEMIDAMPPGWNRSSRDWGKRPKAKPVKA
jgi:hypothetical protein